MYSPELLTAMRAYFARRAAESDAGWNEAGHVVTELDAILARRAPLGDQPAASPKPTYDAIPPDATAEDLARTIRNANRDRYFAAPRLFDLLDAGIASLRRPAASETPAAKHDRPTMFRCPECGPHAKADEDGCCASCGSDCDIVPCDDAAHPPASPPASPARSERPTRCPGCGGGSRDHRETHPICLNAWHDAPTPAPRDEAKERQKAISAMDADSVPRGDKREAGYIEGWLACARARDGGR